VAKEKCDGKVEEGSGGSESSRISFTARFAGFNISMCREVFCVSQWRRGGERERGSTVAARKKIEGNGTSRKANYQSAES